MEVPFYSPPGQRTDPTPSSHRTYFRGDKKGVRIHLLLIRFSGMGIATDAGAIVFLPLDMALRL
ncbi:MAG: hypothetical protein K2H46_11340 [Muribaculaceae bacterium]|nr:hypothetical protein [Muribaculaceae bacterium]